MPCLSRPLRPGGRVYVSLYLYHGNVTGRKAQALRCCQHGAQEGLFSAQWIDSKDMLKIMCLKCVENNLVVGELKINAYY